MYHTFFFASSSESTVMKDSMSWANHGMHGSSVCSANGDAPETWSNAAGAQGSRRARERQRNHIARIVTIFKHRTKLDVD